MELETECFDPNIRETTKSKRRLLTLDETIAFVAFDGDRVVGEAYGLSMAKYKGFPDSQKLVRYYKKSGVEAMYLISLAVLPRYRNVGLGKALKISLMKEAKKLGYDVIVSHAREGAALELNKRLGARVIKPYPDWFGTGETYYLCEIDLNRNNSEF